MVGYARIVGVQTKVVQAKGTQDQAIQTLSRVHDLRYDISRIFYDTESLILLGFRKALIRDKN